MTVFTDQWSFTAPYEGIVRHLYLDSRGFVTAGVGFLVPDEAACARMVWIPNTQEAIADFRRLKEEHGPFEKFAAAHYRPMVRAALAEDFMRQEFARRMADMAKLVGAAFVNAMPLPARVAYLDLCYNLGVGGVSKFHHLNNAIAARDWLEASRQCHRNGVSEKRNAATAAQFASCATL